MNLWANIIQKIENEPWDDWIIASDRWMVKMCLGVCFIAIIYFGGVFLKMWLRG